MMHLDKQIASTKNPVRLIKRIGFLMVLLCFAACSWFYPRYEHPSFYFSFKHPKTWSMQEGSAMQTQLNILLRKNDPRFQPNINFVVQAKSKLTLDQLAYLGQKQLSQLLNDFQVLSQTNINVAGFPCIELRSSYTALNDVRILRTLLFKTDDMDYTVSFTTRQETEERYLPEYHRFIKSLKVPKSVAIALK